MKIIDRVPPTAWTAALGASVLLISLGLWRTNDVLAQNDPVSVAAQAAAETAEATIRTWPQASRAAARAMIAKYGEPRRVTEGELVWTGNGPWEKTSVYRNPAAFLEQTVAYKVPIAKIEDLKRFNGRLSPDSDRGLLSSRSASEPANILALNLADEIVTGKRTVADARGFFAKTARLSAAGKSSAYTEKLRFPARAKTR